MNLYWAPLEKIPVVAVRYEVETSGRAETLEALSDRNFFQSNLNPQATSDLVVVGIASDQSKGAKGKTYSIVRLTQIFSKCLQNL